MTGATIETREGRPVPHFEELWRGSITIPEIFPDRRPDYTQYALWKAPAVVAVFREREDACVFRVSLPANPICGLDLVDLLEAARPEPGYRGKQGRNGILEDWQISTNPSGHLYQMHEAHLGHHWIEFVNNDLSPLMKAINIPSSSEAKLIFQQMIEGLKNGWHTLNGNSQLLEIIERSAELFNVEYQCYPVEKGINIRYSEFFPWDKRIGLYQTLVARRVYPRLILDNPEREESFRDPYYPISSSIKTLENERFELTYGGFSLTVAFADGRIEEIEQSIPQPTAELTPMAIWRTRKRGNKIIRESLAGELPPQLLQNVDGHVSPLLGLTVAVALSSAVERGAILPKELSLHAGGKLQVMMAAQMPLLIKISINRLLEGLSFFPRVEKLVGEIVGIRL